MSVVQTKNNLGAPILNELNNGLLKGPKAMPLKDLTSDGENSFALSRNQYIKSLPNKYVPVGSKFVQTFSLSKTHPRMNIQRTYPANITHNQIKLQKKWIGGNRDSSSVTDKIKTDQIGKGSVNLQNTKMAFTNGGDSNTVRQALARVRSGGSTTPWSKIHKYPNAPIFPK